MKRAAPRGGLWIALVIGATAAAQPPRQEAPLSEPVDIIAGDAVLRGRVITAEPGGDVGALTVILYALAATGEAGLRRGSTDPQGAFVFEDVSNRPDLSYLIGIQYGGIPFAERTAFAEGEREHEVEVRVRKATPSRDAVAVGALRMRIDRGCSGLFAAETVELRNAGERVVFVPPEARASAEPIFRARLPNGARGFQTPGGNPLDGLQLEGDEVRFFGPLYPGSQELQYVYEIATEGTEVLLERSFPSGAERVAILTHARGPTVRGESLREGAHKTFEEQPYRSAETGSLAPGDTLRFGLEIPPLTDAAARLSIPAAQLWLELDDAVLAVDEHHRLQVAGDTPLRSDSEAPLFCLGLPSGAEGLRLDQAAFALGVTTMERMIAVYGPLPAGETSLSLRYQLRADDAGSHFERSFPLDLPLLSILVADTGLRVQSERLHRRRPVRNADRSYLHLEAFEVVAGETVAVGLAPLPAAEAGSNLAAAIFLVAAAGAVVAFIGAPLRTSKTDESDTEGAEPWRQRAEREALYAAMRDLEDDFETGKLSREDYSELRRKLRARVAALLREPSA